MRSIYLLFVVASVLFGQGGRPQALFLADTDAPLTPTDSPGGGTYGSTQSVTLSDPTSTLILYTTNGSTPACPATGTLYTGAISVSVTTTIKAIGCNGVTGGGVLTSVYTITPAGPTFVDSNNIGFGSPTSSPAITLATNPSVGEVLIINLSGSQTSVGSTTSCTDDRTVPNTYTIDNTRLNGTSAVVSLASTKVTSNSGAGNLKITCTTASTSYYFMTVGRFTWGTTLTVDGAPTGVDTSGTVTSVACGSATPGASEAGVSAAAFVGADAGSIATIANTGSSPGSYTIPSSTGSQASAKNESGGAYSIGAFAYQTISSTSGSYAPVFSFASSGNAHSCVQVFYKSS